MQTIKIGTRGSLLALAQAKIIDSEIKKYNKDIETEFVIIKTKGDKILDKPLSEIGDKGLFVSEFEEALIDNEIDIAVHSAKDLPLKLKEGLEIIAAPKRADERDVLITKKDAKDISIIGTSSPRRDFYIKKFFPNSKIKPIRGNVDTRLKKLLNNEYDGIILAKAGLDRLNYHLNELKDFELRIFETKDFLPAACQGIIAVEAKKDFYLKERILKINDEKTFLSYQIERAVIEQLQANCSEISAAYSKIIDGKIELTIMYGGKEISIIETKENIFNVIPKIVAELKS